MQILEDHLSIYVRVILVVLRLRTALPKSLFALLS